MFRLYASQTQQKYSLAFLHPAITAQKQKHPRTMLKKPSCAGVFYNSFFS